MEKFPFLPKKIIVLFQNIQFRVKFFILKLEPKIEIHLKTQLNKIFIYVLPKLLI